MAADYFNSMSLMRLLSRPSRSSDADRHMTLLPQIVQATIAHYNKKQSKPILLAVTVSMLKPRWGGGRGALPYLRCTGDVPLDRVHFWASSFGTGGLFWASWLSKWPPALKTRKSWSICLLHVYRISKITLNHQKNTRNVLHGQNHIKLT